MFTFSSKYIQDNLYSTEETFTLERKAIIPIAYTLHQNYPNPFNPVTNIRFGLPEPRNIRLTVVNVLGQEVAEISSGWHDIGYHDFRWHGLNKFGQNVSAGMYFAVLSDGKAIRVQKMLLLK